MPNAKRKLRKDSLLTFTTQYANNPDACRQVFFSMKWSQGYVCPQCGCIHYCYLKNKRAYQCNHCKHQETVLTGTIFQRWRLDYYTLLMGLFLFFTSNKGISGIEMASHLHVNYKTALLLLRRCRILMDQSNQKHRLDSLFYECDVAFLGTISEGKRGLASDKQPVSVLLSTNADNQYPQDLCLDMVKSESAEWMEPLIKERIQLGKERVLNTDGKTVYEALKDSIAVHCEKVDYTKKDHRLFWLNTMISNLNSVILGIYHGIAKKDLYLFLQEFSWRTNHRNSGATIMQKVLGYIADSAVMTNKRIVRYVQTIYPFIAKLA